MSLGFPAVRSKKVMARKDGIALFTIIAIKVICCGAILLLVLGGLGLVGGLSTGSIVLTAIAVATIIAGGFLYYMRG